MINELVNSILEAEEKSAKILADAADVALAVTENAERKAEEFYIASVASTRAECAALEAELSAKADKAYEDITQEGKQEAKRLKDNAEGKTKELSKQVVRWVLSGDC